MKLKLYLLLGVLVCCLSSCFDLVEEVNLNNDGSGTFSFTANMSQSRERLASIMKQDTFRGYQVPSQQQVTEEIDKVAATLRKTPGITKVETQKDFKSFIFSVRFAFASVDALNKGMTSLQQQGMQNGGPARTVRNYYSYENGVFKRHTYKADEQFGRQVPSAQLSLLQSAKYTCIYRFNKAIKSNTNQRSIISKNKTSLMLKTPIPEAFKKYETLANTITLTP